MNVAIGLINLKNSASLGACPSIGCDTKISEYRTVATINISVTERTTPTINLSNSSGVHSFAGFIGRLTGRDEVLCAVPGCYALRLLALRHFPVSGVLALVAVTVFAPRQHCTGNDKCDDSFTHQLTSTAAAASRPEGQSRFGFAGLQWLRRQRPARAPWRQTPTQEPAPA